MKNTLFKKISSAVLQRQIEIISVVEYLERCRTDKMAYATVFERLLQAIGEPVILDSQKDSRTNIVFEGQRVKTYPAFNDFYGNELEIDAFVSGYLIPASQGLQEARKLALFLGPVASGKTSFVNRLKELIEVNPIYVLASEEGVRDPELDHPLGLFLGHKQEIKEEYGISARYFPACLSPWAVKRLNEYGNDVSRFKIMKIYPSASQQLAIAKSEPLDENNSDIATLIGKVAMKNLQFHLETDADAYNYSGVLCRANRGLCEMAEIYKGNAKTLYPLIEATESQCFNGLEQVGSIPFQGMVVAHCNGSELSKINAAENVALRDRTHTIKFKYGLRWTEEEKIQQKQIRNSALASAPIAPRTTEILAKFAVLSRLEQVDIGDGKERSLFSKMCVYNGDDIKSEDTQALPYTTYKVHASQDEGMYGVSTRTLSSILNRTYNYHIGEDPSADAITLLMVLREQIIKDQLAEEDELRYLAYVDILETKYFEEIGAEIQRAYIENSSFAQAKFDRYCYLAQAYVQNKDYKDPNTGILMDSEEIHKELRVFEQAASVSSYESFRNDIVLYVLSQRAEGNEIKWSSYAKLAKVIEKSVFKDMKDILPIISYSAKQNKDDEVAHKKFNSNMRELGYTDNQIKRLVSYYCSKLHS